MLYAISYPLLFKCISVAVGPREISHAALLPNIYLTLGGSLGNVNLNSTIVRTLHICTYTGEASSPSRIFLQISAVNDRGNLLTSPIPK